MLGPLERKEQCSRSSQKYLNLWKTAPCEMRKTGETKVSKGYQTVVPSDLRQAYGIEPGDRLIWEQERGEIRVRVKKRKTFADIAGIISVESDAVQLKHRAQRGEL